MAYNWLSCGFQLAFSNRIEGIEKEVWKYNAGYGAYSFSLKDI